MADDSSNPSPASSGNAASLETRRAALQQRISYYVRHQYRVLSQTDTTAQLVKPKRFSLIWAIIWLILAVLPFLFYVGYHVFLKRESQVYLTVDEQGRVHETKGKR
jgi:type VI protein secretion system component VasF